MQIAINLATTLAAVVFLIIGGIKIFYTRAYIADSGWAQFLKPSVRGVRITGVVEVLGALGLAMPPVVGVGQPVIPIVAAVVLVIMQIAAIISNSRARAWADATVSAAYILLPAFLVVVYTSVTQASVHWV